MSHDPSRRPLTSFWAVAVVVLSGAPGAVAWQQDVPIVQPGAPGQQSTKLTTQQAVKLADTRYTEDDAIFMRDMIHHHDQAVQMAELVKDRTNLPELVSVAGRINASQADEIAFMQNWLRERGESVPDASAHRGMDMQGTMAGMASAADMAKLATLKGTDNFNVVFRFIITPLFLFSGVFFPLTRLPEGLRIAAWFTPLFHGVELTRGLTLGTLDSPAWLAHVAYLVGMLATGIVAAIWTFDRRLRA